MTLSGLGRADYFVTGGEGFIASAIIRELLSKDKKIISLDAGDFGRLEKEKDDPNLETIMGDVRSPELVDECVRRSDTVLHLAAVVGVDRYLEMPLNVMDVNILGSRNVLDACSKYKRPVIIASSSEVYGKNNLRLREDSNRVYGPFENHRWSYALSKAASEMYAVSFGLDGLRYAIMRYFNIYGPQMDRLGEGRVIAKFLGCIRGGEAAASCE